MSKTIYLVRHCYYANPQNILPGRLPIMLSNEGELQAKRLRNHFAEKNIQNIWSSAVLRCKQTAETISDSTIPITFDQRLLETFSPYQGFWFDGPLGWDHFYLHRPELGGENYDDIRNRVTAFWNEIIISAEEEQIIICSHGDPLYLLYTTLTNRPLPNELEEAGEHGNPLYQGKGSIREVKISGTETIVSEEWNTV
ncbi:MAG TPA: histidine phosphatase family protein [Patescibacteria group bacterium]|nr:histidine phosphatase family protein [Patescibacteria group bacterium]